MIGWLHPPQVLVVSLQVAGSGQGLPLSEMHSWSNTQPVTGGLQTPPGQGGGSQAAEEQYEPVVLQNALLGACIHVPLGWTQVSVVQATPSSQFTSVCQQLPATHASIVHRSGSAHSALLLHEVRMVAAGPNHLVTSMVRYPGGRGIRLITSDLVK